MEIKVSYQRAALTAKVVPEDDVKASRFREAVRHPTATLKNSAME
jgi:hypothetical protein